MTNSFKAVTFEGFSPIASAMRDFPSTFCDHTPYVILIWQKYYDTAFAVVNGYPILRNTVNGEYCYSPLTNDITAAVSSLLDVYGCVTVSPLSDKEKELLSREFKIEACDQSDDWSDYIYIHSDLAELVGKRYAGQRNHINKLLSTYPDCHYEEITSNNLREVLEFYKELTSDVSSMTESALFERNRILEYLDGEFYRLTMPGGLIRAGGNIVSFAFGETLNDTLFVHIEKARKDVQGAYQMIVREFARHNPARFINREEDMGIEGLRISKMSYHPIRLEKKNKMRISK